MRALTLGGILCVCLCVGPALQAQATDTQVMVPINKFLDAFNKGDMAAAATAHAADVVIIDEVPGFLWRGPEALQKWAADLDADSKKRGMTDPKVTIGAPTRVETAGSDAYVIVPATFTFTEKGVAMRESAQMTFVLKNGSSGWLIHAWTWTGPRPEKATSASK